MRQLQDRTAVITGAASGFGLELARLAARAGMSVVLSDIEAEPLARAEAEIQTMIKDAELNAEEDKKQRELIEARNNAESSLHQVKEDIDKYSELISPEEKTNIDDTVQAIKDAITGTDVKIINDSIPKLYEAMKPLIDKKHEAEEKSKNKEDTTVVDAEIVS